MSNGDDSVSSMKGSYSSDYSYYEKIKSPGELEMSGDGSLSALTDDIAGILAYGDVLSSGASEAVDGDVPLGYKKFLPTAASCVDVKTNNSVKRSVYKNTIPYGLFSLGGGGGDRGLVPGLVEDILKLDPLNLLKAFSMDSSPKCIQVTLPVGASDESGVLNASCPKNGSNNCESAYLLFSDIENLPDSDFPSQYPSRTEYLSEQFVGSMLPKTAPKSVSKTAPKTISGPTYKLLESVYLSSIGLLGIYILIRLLTKYKK